MKKKTQLFVCLTTICLLIFACRKREIAQVENPNILGAPPTGSVSFTDPNAIKAQMKRLAIGLSIVANKPGVTTSQTQFKQSIYTMLMSNGGNESFSKLQTDFGSGSNIFTQPTLNNDLYDVMKYGIDNYNPPSPLTSWLPAFFDDCSLNTMSLLTELVIPNDSDQYNRQSNSVIVFVEEQDPSSTIIGYGFNTIKDSIEEYTYSNYDDWETFVDNTNSFVWVISLEDITTYGNYRSNQNCEGGTDCGDEYCQKECGENTSGCPSDCNPNKSKRLILDSVRIEQDFRITNYNSDPSGHHHESAMSGRYDLVLYGSVLHGKHHIWENTENCPLKPRIKLRDVYRCNDNGKCAGSSKWKKVNPRNSTDPVILSESFNVFYDTVYIMIYERDWAGQEEEVAMDWGNNWEYTSQNTPPLTSLDGKANFVMHPAGSSVHGFNDVGWPVIPSDWTYHAPTNTYRCRKYFGQDMISVTFVAINN